MKALAINYLVDAGPLVALLSKDDLYHDWANKTFFVLEETLGTTETAIAEAAHLLKKRRPALLKLVEMVERGAVRILPMLSEQTSRVSVLMGKYPQMDLGNATLVALSEVLPRARLITIDRTDFTVYRRCDGKPVPSIMPTTEGMF